jgi:type IV secretion system protein TrbL
MSCSINPLTWGGCVSSATKAVAADAFDAIARSFGHAAQSATTWLWGQLNAATAVTLGGPGFSTVLGIVAAIAGTVAVGLFVFQVLRSALRREPGGLGRAVKGLFVAFIAGGAAVGVVNLLLSATDSLCNGVVQAAVGTDLAGLGRLVLGSSATATLAGLASGSGAAAGVLLLALAILVAVVIVYAALVIRKVLIVVTAVFAPLAFVGSLADITVAWTRRWIEMTVALIFSKLILVLIFVIGYFMLVRGAGQAGSGVTQEITQVVSGVIVLALAGFAPWLALKVVHFTGDHAQQLHALGASTVGGAAAGARMAQKVSPIGRSANSNGSASNGSATNGSSAEGPPAAANGRSGASADGAAPGGAGGSGSSTPPNAGSAQSGSPGASGPSTGPAPSAAAGSGGSSGSGGPTGSGGSGGSSGSGGPTGSGGSGGSSGSGGPTGSGGSSSGPGRPGPSPVRGGTGASPAGAADGASAAPAAATVP